jgi:hypothetical protein
MNSLGLFQQPVTDIAIASHVSGGRSRIRIFSLRHWPAGAILDEMEAERAGKLASFLSGAGLEFAEDRRRYLVVHRAQLRGRPLRLHPGVNGDKIVACRLEHGVALGDPFLHRGLGFLEIGKPLLDLSVEFAEASRLPGDARLCDRRRDVAAEAAGVRFRR